MAATSKGTNLTQLWGEPGDSNQSQVPVNEEPSREGNPTHAVEQTGAGYPISPPCLAGVTDPMVRSPGCWRCQRRVVRRRADEAEEHPLAHPCSKPPCSSSLQRGCVDGHPSKAHFAAPSATEPSARGKAGKRLLSLHQLYHHTATNCCPASLISSDFKAKCWG